MEQDSSRFFRELKDNISAYADLKLEYYKLTSYEMVGKWGSQLSYVLIMVLAALFILAFFLLSIAFLLGGLFHSYGLGFLCVTVILTICMWIMKITNTKMKHKLLNMIIAGLTAYEERKHESDNNDDDITNNIHTAGTAENTVGEITLPEE